MKIIFHKMSKKYPNTIYGFKDSIRYGYRKFELDVRGCKDRLIIYHDHVCNNEYIENINFYDLKDVDLLDDFIIEANKHSNLEIYLDIKGNSIPDVNKLISVLGKFSNNNNIFVQSFNIDVLKKITTYSRSIKTGLIVAGFHDILFKNFKYVNYLVIEEEFIDKYLDIDIDKYLYTVNLDHKTKQYENYGVKGIFTDYPLKFLQFNYEKY